MPKQPPGNPNSAFEKALRVLACIADSQRSIGLAELAELVDQPRPTLHRILQQLAEVGLILRAPDRDRYCVGPGMMQLSISALTSLSVAPPVRVVLDTLVRHTGETCNVGILDQGEILYIERVEGTLPLRLEIQVGSHVPSHCTAIGKLLVASQHKNVRTRILNVSKLERFTDRTLTEPEALEEEFALIRANGYSFNDEEYVEGLTAIAVPIFDRSEKPIAGLAIHAPRVRMDLEKALSYLPDLRKTALDITQIWGMPAVGEPRDPLQSGNTKSRSLAAK